MPINVTASRSLEKWHVGLHVCISPFQGYKGVGTMFGGCSMKQMSEKRTWFNKQLKGKHPGSMTLPNHKADPTSHLSVKDTENTWKWMGRFLTLLHLKSKLTSLDYPLTSDPGATDHQGQQTQHEQVGVVPKSGRLSKSDFFPSMCSCV